ncbi:tRNA pseudouridine synthase D [BD1-7 clade bacterium]|uniref:tRNA pseudouridine synthase D n=1 Tax=BD1-7 clade bacterium TaxID=2029982 RepID=A0A5S9PEM4_9GAMM|nr:tRNA pseudouridine synthase D [BD1-7 clade bacterium]CAA0102303.1 tRNA pseudouridine synthase D [BD1-7 clade bacterium]
MSVSESQPAGSEYPLNVSRAYPVPDVTGTLKAVPEDFVVEEQLGFEPSGEGEHLWLWVEKRELTTQAVIGDLARQLGVARRDIGYSGLKDKIAVTRQWFSVPWPIKKESPDIPGTERWSLQAMARHDRKLKRGVHKTNAFKLRITQIEGDHNLVDERLALIQQQGFPNYFGEQRFGFGGANVKKAERMFAGALKCKRAERSIYLSAVRSWFFNQYLSERIARSDWCRSIDGDCFSLAGTGSVFGPEDSNQELDQRLLDGDIHIAGPMVGERSRLAAEALAIQQQVEQRADQLKQGLLDARMESALRALRVIPLEMTWQWEGDALSIAFVLPTGAFATALVREMIQVNGALW